MKLTPENQALLVSTVRDGVCDDGFQRATFGGAARGASASPWVRVQVRPVIVRGEQLLQFEYFDAKQSFTKNASGTDAEAALRELLDIGFANIHLRGTGEELEIRTSKKGKVHIARRATAATTGDLSHNRVKDVPLPEGKADRLLVTMGILTADGRVRASLRPKFTQINEFLKHLQHVLEPAGLRSLGRPVEILDCGCGSSYLTLAVHHYLNNVLSIPATILGVDINESVIRKSIMKASQLQAEGLLFACGKIGEIQTRADIVVALHACDTATDDALAQAVRSEAKLVMSVPCCHHHLNRLLRANGPTDVLKPILRHGLLQERTADIVTDSFRALALRIMGYRVDVVEFVSPEHTARNLMIRATRTGTMGEEQFVREYREMRHFWGVTPNIEQAIGESFRDFLRE